MSTMGISTFQSFGGGGVLKEIVVYRVQGMQRRVLGLRCANAKVPKLGGPSTWVVEPFGKPRMKLLVFAFLGLVRADLGERYASFRGGMQVAFRGLWAD